MAESDMTNDPTFITISSMRGVPISHIRMIMDQWLQFIRQHAYCKNKSTEISLYDLIGLIEDSLNAKNNTMVSFFDLEGVFNNKGTA